MVAVTLAEGAKVTRQELLAPYSAVGWSAYTDDPDRLLRAVRRSSFVVTARAESGELVALARAISDDATICYVQDILVRPDQQGEGIGRELLERVRRRFAHVCQIVLLTDAEPGLRAFYERLGLTEIADLEPVPLLAFVRLQS